MTTPTIKLNSGYEMPVLGIGCYILTPEEAENSVYHALKDGYRLIDTANVYMNERGVGRGMKRAIDEGICTREEIFLTTKLWPSEYEYVESAIKDTLARLHATRTGDTASDVFVANLHHLCFNAFALKDLHHLIQRDRCIPAHSGAAVNDQYFHAFPPSPMC